MKTIESAVLGKLTQDDAFEDWWHGSPRTIPLVGKELPFTFMDFEPEADTTFIEEADDALKHFLSLNKSYKEQITGLVFAHFLEFQTLVDSEYIPKEMEGVKESEIWNFIYPTEVLITRRPYNEPDIFINMTCECLWEPEHGLQLVFKKGKVLTRVSDQDGHLTTADAYDIPDNEDELLSKFKE